MSKLFPFLASQPSGAEPAPHARRPALDEGDTAPAPRAPPRDPRARPLDFAQRLQANAVLRGLADQLLVAWTHRGRSDLFAQAVARVLPPYDHTHRMRFRTVIGPSGSGKTTTLARLATREVREGREVVLVTVDHVRLGAFDQIRRVAQLLDCRAVCARDVAELQDALPRLSPTATILVDTAGQAAHGESDLAELLDLLPEADLEILVVLPCNMAAHDLLFWFQRFASYQPHGLVLTRVDEAQRLGAVFNLPYVTRTPLAYGGYGTSLVRGTITWSPSVYVTLLASEDSSSTLSRLADEHSRPLNQAARESERLPR